MGILGRMTGKDKAGPPTAAQLAADKHNLEALIPALEEAVGEASYAVTANEFGSDKALNAAYAALNDAQAKLRTVTNAMAVARKREADAAAQAVAKAHQAKVKATQQHLAKRLEISERIAEGIKIACEGFRELLDNNAKIGEAWPNRVIVPVPKGALFTYAELDKAIRVELHRVGSLENQFNLNNSFPGAHHSQMNLLGNPRNEKPFVELVREANEYVGRALTGKPAVAASSEPGMVYKTFFTSGEKAREQSAEFAAIEKETGEPVRVGGSYPVQRSPVVAEAKPHRRLSAAELKAILEKTQKFGE